MKSTNLFEKMVRLARMFPPSEHVPYAFEKRVMARLASLSVFDVWSVWSRNLWRAATPFVALALFLAVWNSFFAAPGPGADAAQTDLETVVMAPISNLDESW